MGRILGQLAATHERLDLGVLLELVEQLPGLETVAAGAQLLHGDHAAQRDRGAVGVEKAAAGHAAGDLAHEELGGALAFVQAPAILDHAGRQLDDLFEADRVVGGLRLLAQPGGARRQSQHALGDDRHLGADLVVAGSHADHPVAVAQQLVGLHVRDDHGAGLGGLVGEKLIEA